MEIKIDRSFQKDTRKINNKALLEEIAKTIISVRNAENISQIRNLKKLKISSDEFRIKIGNYRLGVKISGSTVFFVRCLHRRDIYKFFPK